MIHQPRWAEMCARILQQCEHLRGGRENLAVFLHVRREELEPWLEARSGPPRSVFERAMEIILEEHDRRAGQERAGHMPRRRQSDH